MNPFDQIAATLAQRSAAGGGTDVQKTAAAALWYGVLLHQLVELSRALKRRDVDASISFAPLGFVFQVGLKFLEVSRPSLAEPAQLRFEWRGFGLPYYENVTKHECEHGAIEEIAARAKEFVDMFTTLLGTTA